MQFGPSALSACARRLRPSLAAGNAFYAVREPGSIFWRNLFSTNADSARPESDSLASSATHESTPLSSAADSVSHAPNPSTLQPEHTNNSTPHTDPDPALPASEPSVQQPGAVSSTAFSVNEDSPSPASAYDPVQQNSSVSSDTENLGPAVPLAESQPPSRSAPSSSVPRPSSRFNGTPLETWLEKAKQVAAEGAYGPLHRTIHQWSRTGFRAPLDDKPKILDVWHVIAQSIRRQSDVWRVTGLAQKMLTSLKRPRHGIGSKAVAGHEGCASELRGLVDDLQSKGIEELMQGDQKSWQLLVSLHFRLLVQDRAFWATVTPEVVQQLIPGSVVSLWTATSRLDLPLEEPVRHAMRDQLLQQLENCTAMQLNEVYFALLLLHPQRAFHPSLHRERKDSEMKEGEMKEGEMKEGEMKEGETKDGETKEGQTEAAPIMPPALGWTHEEWNGLVRAVEERMLVDAHASERHRTDFMFSMFSKSRRMRNKHAQPQQSSSSSDVGAQYSEQPQANQAAEVV